MPILYIHAGMPKTGTSTLQMFMHHNRKVLVERCRLLYPKTGMSREKLHYRLFLPAPDEGADQRWGCLQKEVAQFPSCDVLISAEQLFRDNFKSLEPPYFDLVRQTFPGYEIKIILYVRRLDEYIKSYFNQRTKRGWMTPSSYADFFQYFLADWQGSSYLSHRIASAVNLVGQNNVILRHYDRSMLKDGDIITDFFDLLGLDIPMEAERVLEANTSLPDECLPFLSSALLPLDDQDPLRKEIVELLRLAYTFPKGSGVGDNYLSEFEAEIDKIDAYLPGYRKLFSKRKLSFSFPEVDVKDPSSLFLASLLYKLLMNQQDIDNAIRNNMENKIKEQNHKIVEQQKKIDTMRSSTSWNITRPLRKLDRFLSRLFR